MYSVTIRLKLACCAGVRSVVIRSWNSSFIRMLDRQEYRAAKDVRSSTRMFEFTFMPLNGYRISISSYVID